MRSSWIDSLKGLAIILVVVGHLNFRYPGLNQYIYSFHMPLFFFISGYLFNFGKYLNTEKIFLKKKIYSLIVPYFAFSIITYIFYITLDFLYQPQICNVEIFEKGLFFNLYAVICSASGHLINTPLWFLPCLFITEMLFFALKKYTKQEINFLFLIIFFSFLGYIYGLYIPLRMPWGVDIALTGIVFYSAGNIFKRKYENEFFKISSFLIFFLFLVHLILAFVNPRVDMYNLVYNNYVLFYASAFSGILAYFYVFKTIKPSKILEFYGRNSLTVLGFHYLIKSILKYSLSPLLKYLNLQINEAGLFMVNIFFTLVLLVPIIIVTNRYFSYLIGKSQQTKFTDLKQENQGEKNINRFAK